MRNGDQTTHGGIWTPWGEVLCAECHRKATGNKARGYDPARYPNRTNCDRCGAEVAMDADVAITHNAAATLWRANIPTAMWQTGGMTPGCAVLTEDGGYILVTPADEGGFLVGTYTLDGEPSEDDFTSEGGIKAERLPSTDQEMVELVRRLVEKKGGAISQREDGPEEGENE